MTPTAILDGPAWARAKHFRRQEYQVAIGTSSRQVLQANPNRMGLILSAPTTATGFSQFDGAVASAADTSTAGVKLNKNYNTGSNRVFQSATFNELVVTGVVAAFQLIRTGVTYTLATFTTQGVYAAQMALALNDQLQWNVLTPQATSTSDFTINAQTLPTFSRVTLSINSPVTDGNGICVYAGQAPLVLWRDVVGDALTEDVYGIGNLAGMNIGVWDIFY